MPNRAIKFRPKRKATIVTLIMISVLLALGAWQVKRLHWKEAMLEEISTNASMPAIYLPAHIVAKGWEHRHVKLTGSFITGKDFLIKPRTKDGKVGVHVLRPFKSAGGIIFVNLGWSEDGKIKGTPEPDGFIQIPAKGYFTPENNPAKNDWYWPDAEAMGKRASLKDVQPFIVVHDLTIKDIPNDHLQYAIFWFFMAFVMGGVYIISQSKKS